MKNKRISQISYYILMFFAVWSVYEFTLKIVIFDTFTPVIAQCLNSVIKIVVWTIPCIFFTKKNKNLFVPLNDMFTNKVKWLHWLPLFLLIAGYLVGTSWLFYGNIAIRATFEPVLLIGGVLFVGITEEFVFRGWLLNTLLKCCSKSIAVIISSVLFLVIHFPVWLVSGNLYDYVVSGSFIEVLLVSVLLSCCFIKSKSLLVPIALHMFWNLVTFLVL